jgi:four helix bundle protein
MTAGSVEELRAWQETYGLKLAIYALIRSGPIAQDSRICDQLREAAASAVSQIEEGFGRFYPKDFGRMVVGAKSSVKECGGHLRDAVDRGYITDEVRKEHDRLAQNALREMAGLIDYLQSPEAEQNAKRIREKRIERRRVRLQNKEPGTPNPEPRTPNPNPNPEPEPEPEPRTRTRTRTPNPNPNPNLEPEPEPEPRTRTRNPEPGTRNVNSY